MQFLGAIDFQFENKEFWASNWTNQNADFAV